MSFIVYEFQVHQDKMCLTLERDAVGIFFFWTCQAVHLSSNSTEKQEIDKDISFITRGYEFLFSLQEMMTVFHSYYQPEGFILSKYSFMTAKPLEAWQFKCSFMQLM